MRNFQGYESSFNFVAGANLSAGTGLLVGNTFGVVTADVASGATGSLYVGPGQVSLPKAASITPAQGVLLYWDNTAGNVTTAASGNRLIGTAGHPLAAAGDATINVRLDGVAR